MTIYENIAFGLTNIKKQMPKVDLEARRFFHLIEILEHPDEALKIIREKLDESRTLERFIEAYSNYEISKGTAKALLRYVAHGYNQDQIKDVIQELRMEIQNKESKLEGGQRFDENFNILQDGQPVTEYRALLPDEIDLTVRRVAKITKIGSLLNYYPSGLSNGQRQRTALARTLAPAPKVMLMDEPLSDLDTRLGLEMAYELQRLHMKNHDTCIYVTHDHTQAMTLADHVCLISDGILQQYDAPMVVYERPNNLFAADFVGNPPINFIEAKGHQRANGIVELYILDNRKVLFRPSDYLNLEDWFVERDRYRINAGLERGNDGWTNEDFVLGIRPEFITIAPVGGFGLRGEIYGTMPSGMMSTIKISIDDQILTSVIFGPLMYHIGDKIEFNFSGTNILLFDKKSGQRIALGRLETEWAVMDFPVSQATPGEMHGIT